MKHFLELAALAVYFVIAASASEYTEPALAKRQEPEDSYKIFVRKRNGHACMMSIVFIVIFPIGAMFLHFPLRGIRVVSHIHAPLQILGFAMMIGAMGLGIDIARTDLHYISPPKAHVVIGLLTCSMIILFQPALGIYHHVHYKRTGQKTTFAYIHRWIGRIAIILGWINTGLGFNLYPWELLPSHVIVREYVLLGALGGIWWSLLAIDAVRNHWLKKQKISSFAIGWQRGPRLVRDDQPEFELKEVDRNGSHPALATA